MRSASAAAVISCPQLAGRRGRPSCQWTLVSAPSVCLGFTHVNNSFILVDLPITLSFLSPPHPTRTRMHARTHTHMHTPSAPYCTVQAHLHALE